MLEQRKHDCLEIWYGHGTRSLKRTSTRINGRLFYSRKLVRQIDFSRTLRYRMSVRSCLPSTACGQNGMSAGTGHSPHLGTILSGRAGSGRQRVRAGQRVRPESGLYSLKVKLSRGWDYQAIAVWALTSQNYELSKLRRRWLLRVDGGVTSGPEETTGPRLISSDYRSPCTLQ